MISTSFFKIKYRDSKGGENYGNVYEYKSYIYDKG